MSDLAKRLIDAAEPRYTLAEAIDKILDGLRLEWEAIGEAGSISAKTIVGDYVVRDAHDHGCEWWLCLKGNTKHVSNQDNAKAACLADYKSRFRAEIERTVKS